MVPMTQAIDVLVRGAGVVGHAAALLLAQSRLKVGLLAGAAHAGGPDIRAYALNAASRALLQSLRAWPLEAHCTPVARMQVWGDTTGHVEFSASALGTEALAWIVDAAALENALAQALHYQPQIQHLQEAAPAALSVVCEGSASATRAFRAINFEISRYPQRALAARLRCTQPHDNVARQWFVSSPEGSEVLALLPMAGDEVALVWSLPSERVDALQAMEPSAFAQAVQACCASVAGADCGPLSLCSERASWPLALGLASRWVENGIALAGDAAHTVHPLAGQGLNLGLADAAALARIVAAREYWRSPGDEKLLRRYERERKADAQRMGLATDGLQRLFAHSDARVQALRNWGMLRFGRSGPVKDWVARQAMGV